MPIHKGIIWSENAISLPFFMFLLQKRIKKLEMDIDLPIKRDYYFYRSEMW